MKSELRTFPSYCLLEKGNLSIEKLIFGASRGYPDYVLKVATKFTIDEIDEAGRCLAVERATACGFHIPVRSNAL